MRYLFFVITALLLSSCLTPAKLHKDLTSDKASIWFSTQSDAAPAVNLRQQVMIAEPIISYRPFKQNSFVTSTRSLTIPLLVLNIWSRDFDYFATQEVVREQTEGFVRKALVDQSQTSLAYVGTTSAESPFVLEIEIDSIKARGSYHAQGTLVYMLFFWVEARDERGEAGFAFSRFRYRLRKGDEVIFERVVESEKQISPNPQVDRNLKGTRLAFNRDLVTALSLSIQDNIVAIGRDLDQYFASEALGD